MGRDASIRELLGRAATTARSEGLHELLRRSVPVVKRRRNRVCKRRLGRAGGIPAGRRYLRVRRLVRSRSITDADPFERLWVDPARIESQVRTPTNRWGRVAGGDWDLETTPFEETVAYRSAAAHFERGLPWRETPEFEQYRERLEAGEQPKGCTTERELETRFDELDAIYERLATEGYRSQPELWADRPAYQREVFYKWDQTIDPRLDEITVSIGRSGDLLHSDRGDHRLAMAKLLGLESIPVLVRRRHVRWQSVREAVSTAGEQSELTEREQGHLEHSDLADCHAFGSTTDGNPMGP